MDNYEETFETWNNIAGLYQDKFMQLDLYHATYDHICDAIAQPNAKILEIGCGPGNITKYLLSQRPDFNIFGIDVAPKMIDLAKKNNPAASFSVMDIRKINTIDAHFDGIIGGFCLPYLSQVEGKALIHNAYHLLNDSGLIYLSFVEGDPDKSGFKMGNGGRVFFYFHDIKRILRQLIEAKFDDIKTFKVNYKTSEIHTILTAKKTK